MIYKDYKIFLVEDDDIDFKHLKRTMKKLGISNPLVRATDGEIAINMLKNHQDSLGSKFIVLLDIGLPKLNGLEVLREIRGDCNLKNIPVFMLTSSDHDKDVDLAHQLSVSGYLVKPVKVDGLMDMLRKLEGFLSIVELPEVHPRSS